MAEATHDRALAPARRSSSELAPRPVRVLVAVGDEAARGRAVASLSAGRDVKPVPDGPAALAAVLDAAPDVLLVDERVAAFLMPALRADPRTRGLAVVVLAARQGDGR